MLSFCIIEPMFWFLFVRQTLPSTPLPAKYISFLGMPKEYVMHIFHIVREIKLLLVTLLFVCLAYN